MADEYKIPKCEKCKQGYRIRLRVDGKSQYIYGKTEREVKTLARKIKNGAMEEAAEKPKYPTLEQALNDYINSREPVLSPSTIKGYWKIKNNAFLFWHNRRISDIDYQYMVNRELREREISAKTMQSEWGLVRAAIKPYGISPAVQLPQIVKNERNFLDSDEIKKFLIAINGDPAEMAALLMLHSLRLSEVMGLTWKNLTENTITVRGAAVYDKNGKLVHKDENKTTLSQRTIPVFIPRLSELVREQKQDAGNVVTIAENTIYRHIVNASKWAGVPKVSPHCLRHSFCSVALIDAQLPEAVVSEIGGWGNDGATMRRIYTHVNKRHLESAAEKLKINFAQKSTTTEPKSPKNGDC